MKIINEEAIRAFHLEKAEKEYQRKVDEHLEELKRQRDEAIHELESRAKDLNKESKEEYEKNLDVADTRGTKRAIIAALVTAGVMYYLFSIEWNGFLGLMVFIAPVVVFVIVLLLSSMKVSDKYNEKRESITERKTELRDEISKRYLDNCEQIRNGQYLQLQQLHTEILKKAERDAEEEIAKLKEENLKEEQMANAEPVDDESEAAAVRFRDRILLSSVDFNPIIEDAVARLSRCRDTIITDPDKEFYEIVVDFDVKTKGIYYSVPKGAGEVSTPHGYLFSFFDHRYQDLGEDDQRAGFAMALQQYIDERLPEIFADFDLRKNWERKKDWMRLRLQYLNPDFNQLQSWD
ncbi:hypothetical protein [Butyrivibrio sp. WCE2006]|uniref:hypothetical protein n=1 Tax=Butyrivibrio sp. WCE2006 TaxID=1410611 RepID=UPI0005D1CE55|nr:hypothetical protein [Butyrivibrio sp. WCE2006]